jgi:hypothetical protein
LVLIDNYWQLSIGVRKNAKLVIERKNNRYFVVSGMEFEKGDEIDFKHVLLSNYSTILFLSNEIQPNQIEEIKKDYKIKTIKELNRFSWIELSKK